MMIYKIFGGIVHWLLRMRRIASAPALALGLVDKNHPV